MNKKKNKKKYNLGGALKDIGTGANLLGNFIPGAGAVGGVLSTIGNFIDKPKTTISPAVQINSNPYFKHGGLLETASKHLVGPDHSQGGIPIDNKGFVSREPTGEAEGNEKVIKLLGNRNYILPKSSAEIKMSNKLDKKYSNAALDPLEENALKMSNMKLAASNEKTRIQKEAVEFENGGYFKHGGPLSDKDAILKEYFTNKAPSADVPTFDNGGDPFRKLLSPMNRDGFARTSPQFDNQVFENQGGINLPSLQFDFNSLNLPTDTASTSTNEAVSTELDGRAPINKYGKISDILKGGVAAFDTLKGALSTPDPVNPRIPDYGAATDRFNRMSADLTQARQDAQASNNALVNQIDNSTRSAGVRNANIQAAYRGLSDTLSNIGLKEQGLRNQILSQQGQFESRKAQDTSNREFRADELFAQNKAQVDRLQERAVDTYANLSDDFSKRQFAQDMLSNRLELAQLKTAQGFALLNQMATDFGLGGSEEYNEYLSNPTKTNANKLIKSLKITVKDG